MAHAGQKVAVRSRELTSDEILYAEAKAAAGFPVSAIAKMMGRSVEHIQPYVPAQPRREAPNLGPRPVVAVVEPVPTKPYRAPRLNMPPRAAEVVERIATQRRVSASEIIGQSRIRSIVHVRHEVMFELSALGIFSTPQIGKFLGNRDHTTVLFGIAQHKARMETTL